MPHARADLTWADAPPQPGLPHGLTTTAQRRQPSPTKRAPASPAGPWPAASDQRSDLTPIGIASF